jgi:hypothetical protein
MHRIASTLNNQGRSSLVSQRELAVQEEQGRARGALDLDLKEFMRAAQKVKA